MTILASWIERLRNQASAVARLVLLCASASEAMLGQVNDILDLPMSVGFPFFDWILVDSKSAFLP